MLTVLSSKKQHDLGSIKGYNSRFIEAMTMNFCEQKLDYIWRNFDVDQLV
jgi:hypothetical protein